jgi:hypothetical protein
VIKICYSGSCPSELWSGECGHKKSQGPRPCSFETDEEAIQAQKDYEDERGDYLYEQWKDRHLESHPRNFNRHI